MIHRKSPSRILWFLVAIVCLASVIGFVYERSTHASFGGIDIKGPAPFRQRTLAALRLLQDHAPEDYAEVASVVKQVRHAGRSGTEVESGRVSIADPSSLDASLAWYASVLAHEARHVRLFRIEGKHRTGDAVFAAEVDCIRIQFEVLRRVGGDWTELTWLATQRHGHHPDTDGDGKYTWDDYYQRRW